MQSPQTADQSTISPSFVARLLLNRHKSVMYKDRLTFLSTLSHTSLRPLIAGARFTRMHSQIANADVPHLIVVPITSQIRHRRPPLTSHVGRHLSTTKETKRDPRRRRQPPFDAFKRLRFHLLTSPCFCLSLSWVEKGLLKGYRVGRY